MREIILNAHIHTRYSDGTKTHQEIAEIAAEEGLDAILVTDHNVFPRGLAGYYQFNGKQILVIVGEEIHDVNRNPQKNHLLAFRIDKDYSNFATDPQNLIHKIRDDGGLTFIAHAYDPALPQFGEDDLSWEDWAVEDFTGIELWNNLSEFKVRFRHKLQAYFYALFPNFMALEPPQQIREIWDRYLIKGKQMVAIGGADAHTLIHPVGPFPLEVFPYRYHFRTINNHLLVDEPLNGNEVDDRNAIFNSLRRGNLFIANDLVHPAKGFVCFLEKGNRSIQMGENTSFEPGMKIQAELPAKADTFIVRDGKRIKEFRHANSFTYPIQEEGVYRLESYRRDRFERRGWIFTNPFYIL